MLLICINGLLAIRLCSFSIEQWFQLILSFKCGGFGVASAVYREQLAALRKSDMPLVEYVEVVEKVYGFL